MTEIKQETYHSSALGDIPLSFTGRHLLQNLREATLEAIKAYQYTDQVSLARGRIAEYMSKLEQRKPQHEPNLSNFSDHALIEEIARRLVNRRP